MFNDAVSCKQGLFVVGFLGPKKKKSCHFPLNTRRTEEREKTCGIVTMKNGRERGMDEYEMQKK